jgi:hypothetical protein
VGVRDLASIPGPALTIVGGQPTRDAAAAGEVALGLEQLLLRAARDPDLRTSLERDRRAALEVSGVELTASERATLLAIGDQALAAMIRALHDADSAS